MRGWGQHTARKECNEGRYEIQQHGNSISNRRRVSQRQEFYSVKQDGDGDDHNDNNKQNELLIK